MTDGISQLIFKMLKKFLAPYNLSNHDMHEKFIIVNIFG